MENWKMPEKNSAKVREFRSEPCAHESIQCLPYSEHSMNLDGGWLTCNLTSFSAVFKSYQDDGQMIMKGCLQYNALRRSQIRDR